ncbi:cysteine desulfurase family protein [Thermodesulfovibrio sp. 3907-1M]|uniref:cysteine desulfurase n=1 Tax=Thermodesulfovibrio autotrophicus TaxID=3118333 RepID=A0AAU8H208_9BACT
MIYLDYNATTPIEPRVKEEIVKTLQEFGNPSSSHEYGKKAKQIIESARAKVAKLIDADPEEIIFTSGGTESNNLAIFGRALCFERGHIITSQIEHPSVFNTCRQLARMGYEVTFLPVSSSGMIEPDDVKRAIRMDTVLVTIMHSNNETGVIQPIREIAEILMEKEIPFHTDCAQSIGKVRVSVKELKVSMLTLAGHKFYAPKGIGALYLRKDFFIKPLLFGASHEKGLRPGTENTPYIAGLGKAAEIISVEFDTITEHLKHVTEFLLKGLIELPGIKHNGAEAPRLPNTINVSIKGIIADEFIERLSKRVAISAGSACHAGIRKPSHVLLSMGLSEEEALSSIRISTGKFTTPQEVMEAIEIIKQELKRIYTLRS